MATSFDTIYGLNSSIMTDSRTQNLATNLYYYNLFQYISYAIAAFRGYCYKDLDLRTDFSQEIYTFTGDGVSGDFTLSPDPPSGVSLYVAVDDVETTSYTYNSTTKIVSITPVPSLSSEVYVGAYIIGTFTETLNIDEQRILSEGMTIPFIESNINMTKQLNQMIYGTPVGLHSQANHNKTNLQIKETAYNRLERMIIDYTFTNDDDDLADLVGSDS